MDAQFLPAPPSGFLCPLSGKLMSDPVIIASGITYERANIRSWFSKGNLSCPLSGESVSPSFVLPNVALRASIQEWYGTYESEREGSLSNVCGSGERKGTPEERLDEMGSNVKGSPEYPDSQKGSDEKGSQVYGIAENGCETARARTEGSLDFGVDRSAGFRVEPKGSLSPYSAAHLIRGPEPGELSRVSFPSSALPSPLSPPLSFPSSLSQQAGDRHVSSCSAANSPPFSSASSSSLSTASPASDFSPVSPLPSTPLLSIPLPSSLRSSLLDENGGRKGCQEGDRENEEGCEETVHSPFLSTSLSPSVSFSTPPSARCSGQFEIAVRTAGSETKSPETGLELNSWDPETSLEIRLVGSNTAGSEAVGSETDSPAAEALAVRGLLRSGSKPSGSVCTCLESISVRKALRFETSGSVLAGSESVVSSVSFDSDLKEGEKDVERNKKKARERVHEKEGKEERDWESERREKDSAGADERERVRGQLSRKGRCWEGEEEEGEKMGKGEREREGEKGLAELFRKMVAQGEVEREDAVVDRQVGRGREKARESAGDLVEREEEGERKEEINRFISMESNENFLPLAPCASAPCSLSVLSPLSPSVSPSPSSPAASATSESYRNKATFQQCTNSEGERKLIEEAREIVEVLRSKGRLSNLRGSNMLASRSPNSAPNTRSNSDSNPSVRLSSNSLQREKEASELSSQFESMIYAATRMRELTKSSKENRKMFGKMRAVKPLLALLNSTHPDLVEQAVFAVLNLSIDDANKREIVSRGGVRMLVLVLRTANKQAREGAVACLFSLSFSDEYKPVIVREGAVPGLLAALSTGSEVSKQDAVLALHNLSLLSANKHALIQCGSVCSILHLISEQPQTSQAERAVTILGHLASRAEAREEMRTCCVSVSNQAGSVPTGSNRNGLGALCQMLEQGTPKGKENAASVLSLLCKWEGAWGEGQRAREGDREGGQDRERGVRRQLWEEDIISPLMLLAHEGTSRGREKAKFLLQQIHSFALSPKTGVEKNESIQNKKGSSCSKYVPKSASHHLLRAASSNSNPLPIIGALSSSPSFSPSVLSSSLSTSLSLSHTPPQPDSHPAENSRINPHILMHISVSRLTSSEGLYSEGIPLAESSLSFSSHSSCDAYHSLKNV